ncbi:hypothetical protein KJ605_01810 [Patescibacteria group bacterium]|nr:hypothetical protein [Patescibacteria group bacterium]MBU1970491.1 hypothetical protein [Patescibacteria group bacterium]
MASLETQSEEVKTYPNLRELGEPADAEKYAVVEAIDIKNKAEAALVELQNLITQLKQPEPDFTIESSSRVLDWFNETHEALSLITKRGEPENPQELDQEFVIRLINHRIINSCNLVCMALDLGDLDLLLIPEALTEETNQKLADGQLSKKEIAALMTEKVETTASAMAVSTFLIRGFLLMAEVADTNLDEVSDTLSSLTGLEYRSALSSQEAQITDSPTHYPLWAAAAEEIIWNAKKYGANKISLWREGDYFCFGNNGKKLSESEATIVNGGGVRLYQEVEGTGSGIKIIQEMGFDYQIRPATQQEHHTRGINTVVSIKASDKRGGVLY